MVMVVMMGGGSVLDRSVGLFLQCDFVLTEVPHAFLVRVIQEKIALLDGPVDLEAKTQACVLHQVRQDVLS